MGYQYCRRWMWGIIDWLCLEDVDVSQTVQIN